MEQRPNFKWNEANKDNIGNREHKKIIDRGTSKFVSGGTREQVPSGRASIIVLFELYES